MEFQHQPVLAAEVVENLKLKPGGLYVDGTLGGGGHSRAILQAEPASQIIGIDQDPVALQAAQDALAIFGDRVRFVHNNFRYMDEVLETLGVHQVDGIILDLGVSSPQLDEESRGFSYQGDARLDMRMDPTNPTTAWDLVNGLSVQKLKKIIWDYGEERWAQRIAEFIDLSRKQGPIDTTAQLVTVIKAAIPKGARRDGPHPASRTFQALRIAVNDELECLTEAVTKAVNLLKPGGRLCIISFHSLEDRIVKRSFQQFSNPCICPPQLPVCSCNRKKLVQIITRKPIVPSLTQIQANPRARSAKLRVCQRQGEEER